MKKKDFSASCYQMAKRNVWGKVKAESIQRWMTRWDGSLISVLALVVTRATKSQWSQKFSAFFKVYETSTNQIFSLIARATPKLLGQNFLQHRFFLLIDILLKLQQQIWYAFASLVEILP